MSCKHCTSSKSLSSKGVRYDPQAGGNPPKYNVEASLRVDYTLTDSTNKPFNYNHTATATATGYDLHKTSLGASNLATTHLNEGIQRHINSFIRSQPPGHVLLPTNYRQTITFKHTVNGGSQSDLSMNPNCTTLGCK